MSDERLVAIARERLGLDERVVRHYCDLTAVARMTLTRREREAWQRLDNEEDPCR